MTAALAILLFVHGALHLLGAAKSFRWADLPQLTEPIAPAFGALWLLATILFITSAVSLFVSPRQSLILVATAVTTSMVAIAASWADAKAGAVVNLIVVLAMVAYVRLVVPASLGVFDKR